MKPAAVSCWKKPATRRATWKCRARWSPIPAASGELRHALHVAILMMAVLRGKLKLE